MPLVNGSKGHLKPEDYPLFYKIIDLDLRSRGFTREDFINMSPEQAIEYSIIGAIIDEVKISKMGS